MMERISCTVCGRPISPGRWARFVRRATENGYETVVACNLHSVDELENEVVNDPPDVKEKPPELPPPKNETQQTLSDAANES